MSQKVGSNQEKKILNSISYCYMQNHIPTMLNSPLYFPRAGFLAARLFVP